MQSNPEKVEQCFQDGSSMIISSYFQVSTFFLWTHFWGCYRYSIVHIRQRIHQLQGRLQGVAHRAGSSTYFSEKMTRNWRFFLEMLKKNIFVVEPPHLKKKDWSSDTRSWVIAGFNAKILRKKNAHEMSLYFFADFQPDFSVKNS